MSNSIVFEEKKYVNKLVMTFEEICKIFNNIENGSKIVRLNECKFDNGINIHQNPDSIEIFIDEKNIIYEYLKEVKNCYFDVEQFIEARKNKADKIVKVEFFNEEDNSGFKIIRQSDLEEFIDKNYKSYSQEDNINIEIIDYFDSYEPALTYDFEREELLKIKEFSNSQFFKLIFNEEKVLVEEPYYIYDKDDYLIDLRTSKKYLTGLKYKTQKGEVKCPEVHAYIYAPETDEYSEFIMLKFSVRQDKFFANLKFLLYNI